MNTPTRKPTFNEDTLSAEAIAKNKAAAQKKIDADKVAADLAEKNRVNR